MTRRSVVVVAVGVFLLAAQSARADFSTGGGLIRLDLGGNGVPAAGYVEYKASTTLLQRQAADAGKDGVPNISGSGNAYCEIADPGSAVFGSTGGNYWDGRDIGSLVGGAWTGLLETNTNTNSGVSLAVSSNTGRMNQGYSGNDWRTTTNNPNPGALMAGGIISNNGQAWTFTLNGLQPNAATQLWFYDFDGTYTGNAYTMVGSNTATLVNPVRYGGNFTFIDTANEPRVGFGWGLTVTSSSAGTITGTMLSSAGLRGMQIYQAPASWCTSTADGDWAADATWNASNAPSNPTTLSAYNVTVSHAVTYSQSIASNQTVAALTLDGNADLTIPSGAGLTGPTEVKAGNLQVQAGGVLNATTLKVSGGTAGFNGGTIGTLTATGGTTTVGGGSVTTLNSSATGTAVSGGTVTNLNITAGSANLTGGTIPTLNASGGSTTLATKVGVLNANSGSTILGGAGGGAATAVLKTGSTVDTQGNYLAITDKITLNNGMQISVSNAPVSVDLQGAVGDNIGNASKVARLRLNGGKVSLYKAGVGPETVLWSEGFETNGQGDRYTSNTNTAATSTPEPAAAALTSDNGRWGRVTSIPGSTPSTYYTATNPSATLPTEGSAMWLAEDTTSGKMTNTRATDGMEQGSASWLDFNQLSVAGKTSLRLTVDLFANGRVGTSGPDTNDEFRIRVKNIATGITTDVEFMEGTGSNTPYTSRVNGTLLNTPGAAKSMSYDLTPVGLTTSMLLSFVHSQSGGTGLEYLAFDNIKVYGREIVSDPIDLGATSLELTADTTLDLGLASAASFFDVFLEVGATTPRTLRLTGANFGVVSGLATYFDVTANNNANVSLGTTDGTTYQDVVVIPEPATMSLLVLGGMAALIRRRNRR